MLSSTSSFTLIITHHPDHYPGRFLCLQLLLMRHLTQRDTTSAHSVRSDQLEGSSKILLMAELPYWYKLWGYAYMT